MSDIRLVNLLGGTAWRSGGCAKTLGKARPAEWMADIRADV